MDEEVTGTDSALNGVDEAVLEQDVHVRMMEFRIWEKTGFWRGFTSSVYALAFPLAPRQIMKVNRPDLASEKLFRSLIQEEFMKAAAKMTPSEMDNLLTYAEALQQRLHEEQFLSLAEYQKNYLSGMRTGLIFCWVPFVFVLLSLFVPPFTRVGLIGQIGLTAWWVFQPGIIWLLTRRHSFKPIPTLQPIS